MRYSLNEDHVVYIEPGRKGVSILCLEGRLWLTIEADSRDYELAPGDRMVVKSGAKTALMAFSDSRLILTGCRFRLSELKPGDGLNHINTISVRQTSALPRPARLDRQLLAPPPIVVPAAPN